MYDGRTTLSLSSLAQHPRPLETCELSLTYPEEYCNLCVDDMGENTYVMTNHYMYRVRFTPFGLVRQHLLTKWASPDRIRHVAVHQDQLFIATLSGHVYIWQITEPIRLIRMCKLGTGLHHFAVCGSQLVYQPNIIPSRLRVYNWKTDQQRECMDMPATWVNPMVCHPLGGLVASQGHRVYVLNRALTRYWSFALEDKQHMDCVGVDVHGRIVVGHGRHVSIFTI
jgi:hypothetical protein